ncbi:putative uncharacterized protein DDB_G0282129 [Penaeus japonicus]|uniref:putative uncharacterized protein DDB_G0282129 n=1 Tax=Penaeus japonicus TaxID=27405 RepID=UPI001C710B03|nr:putative uncharacterized protein DDB_G0282129 [Penaeus japonicus]
MGSAVVFLIAMVAPVWASRNSLLEDAQEVAYHALAYDLEVILQQHLNNWKFLTETPSTIDMGEVLDKKRFLNPKDNIREASHVPDTIRRAKDENWSSPDATSVTCETILCSEVRRVNPKAKLRRNASASGVQERNDTFVLQERSWATRGHNPSEAGVLARQDNGGEQTEEKDQGRPQGRERRQSNIPVMYMPGKKTKRKCVAAGGILSGHNAFSFLSFVTGVLSLVLNVNNNINNNNDNNNLNDNNAISNNNVDANANTQNANQIVVFPPGRKKRSINDWRFLQFIGQWPGKARKEDDVDFKHTAWECNKDLNHHVTDAMTAGLRLVSASTVESLANSLSRSHELAFDDTWRHLSREIQQMRASGGSGALLASAVRAASRGWSVDGSRGGGRGSSRRPR